MDAWRDELEPGAGGWLGGTYGIDDDNEFIGVVRFDSRESAMRNSERPEQGAWWAETEKCFDGDVTFHDCDDVTMMLDGGSDDAGFVQVIQGRISDPEKFRMMRDMPMDMLHTERPDIIGGTIAVDKDGYFTQTMAFRTEAEAREGEKKPMPPETHGADGRHGRGHEPTSATTTCTTPGSLGRRSLTRAPPIGSAARPREVGLVTSCGLHPALTAPDG